MSPFPSGSNALIEGSSNLLLRADSSIDIAMIAMLLLERIHIFVSRFGAHAALALQTIA